MSKPAGIKRTGIKGIQTGFTYLQRGHGVSFYGDIQHPSGRLPGQPIAGNCFSRGVELSQVPSNSWDSMKIRENYT